MSFVYVGPDKKETELELICDGEYHRLDVGDYTPPVGGVIFASPYINVTSGYTRDTETVETTFVCAHCGKTHKGTTKIPRAGRLRIRMVREAFNGEPDDATHFFDIPLDTPTRGTLDSRSIFESGEKHRPLHWEYAVTGANNVTMSTRYVRYDTQVGRVDL